MFPDYSILKISDKNTPAEWTYSSPSISDGFIHFPRVALDPPNQHSAACAVQVIQEPVANRAKPLPRRGARRDGRWGSASTCGGARARPPARGPVRACWGPAERAHISAKKDAMRFACARARDPHGAPPGSRGRLGLSVPLCAALGKHECPGWYLGVSVGCSEECVGCFSDSGRRR